jgi:hypothetical protein
LGKDVEQVIPPPKSAVIQKGKRGSPLPDYLIQRNEAVEHINLRGSKSWKQAHGYHRRSLNEALMFRYQTVFGSVLNARIMENQKTEVDLKCSIPNKFAGTGMPDSCKVN